MQRALGRARNSVVTPAPRWRHTALAGVAGTLLLVASNASALTLHHRQRFDASRLQIRDGEGGVSVTAQGLPRTWEAGQPELPYEVVTFLVPQGQRIGRIRVSVKAERLLRSGIQIEPAQPLFNAAGEVAQPPPGFAKTATASYPPEAAVSAGGGAIHGYQLASVRVYPVRYEAGSLFVHERLDLDIDLVANAAQPLERERFSPEIEAAARAQVASLVVNPEAIPGYGRRIGNLVESDRRGFHPTQAPSLEGSPVEQVIVTNEALAPSFQLLADWKTRRGVPTVVRTIPWIEANYRHGSDLHETLRNFIRAAYTKWAVRYVLLGGDTDIIPARYGTSLFGPATDEQIPTDMYFACLDGTWNADGDALWGEAAVYNVNLGDETDLYAEVFVGRLPVSTTAEAAVQISKVFAYEASTQTSYQNRMLFLSEVLFPVDWEEGQSVSQDGADYSEYDLAPLVDPCTSVARLYQNDTAYPGASPLTLQSTLAALNTGYGFVNHIGHGFRYNMSVGDQSLLNQHAAGLTNGDKRFVLYFLNCTATAFDFTCLAEAFLDAPGGAVAVLGSSRAAFPFPARNYNVGFLANLYDSTSAKNLGALFVASRLSYTPNALYDTSDHYTHYLYNLLGDPEMVVHTCTLGATTVMLPGSVGLGQTPVNVQVRVNGVPRQDALVCLQKGVEEYVHGRTDAAGNVSLPFVAETAGSIDVTVSGQNMTTSTGTITVSTTGGAYVHVQSLALDDDSVGGTLGNADAVLDAGETLAFDLVFANSGNDTATNVSGVLRISSPWVALLDSTYSVGNLGASATTAVAGQVLFSVAAAAPDGTVLPCTFLSTNGSSTWTDRVNQVVHAPDTKLVLLRVADPAPDGNGDGSIQAGETFDLYPTVKNFGTGAVTGLQATLATSDPDVNLFAGVTSLGSLNAIQEIQAPTPFHLRENVLAENLMTLQVTDGFGRLRSWNITLRGPAAPAAPVLDPSQGATVVVSSWTPNGEPDLAGYLVYRSTTGMSPWTRVTRDATARMAYFRDNGLTPSTRYDYYVTAVDSSGNESPPSAASQVNTSPPQLAGWPIQMKEVSSCPIAVGDITGDGSREIVAGNKGVYAWSWQGNELRDDDNDPQTWGVFANEIQTVTAAVVLAELDPAPGLEVFVAAWGENGDGTRALVLRGDGSIPSGWPQNPAPLAAPPGYWGSPAACDVDGDGFAELFAPAKNGSLYAWRRDGAPLAATAEFKTGLGTWSRCSPTFANVDGDPQPEIIYAAPTGLLYIWNADGSTLPRYPMNLGTIFLSSTAIGDVDNDGDMDIVAVAEGDSLYVIDAARAKRLPGWPVALSVESNPVSPSPALADLDFDGFLEIVVANNALPSTQAAVRVYNHTGQLRPGWPRFVDNHTSESSPIVADFSGDGIPDIVFGNEGALIYGWDKDGVTLPGFPLTVNGEVRSTPSADDIDGDGDIDLLLAGWDKNLWIWDFPAPYAAAAAQWPTFKHDPQRTGYFGHTAVSPTDVGDHGRLDEAPPQRASLGPNVPNPFNPVTSIPYAVPAAAGERVVPVRIDVFDVRGRLVRRLVHGEQAPGRYRALWDGRDDAGRPAQSGVYFARLQVVGDTQLTKLMLLR